MNAHNKTAGPVSHDKVAPELRAPLGNFPALDFTPEFMALLRSGLAMPRSMQPPELTPEQEAVRCEERRIPGFEGEPEVRVLVYTPPGPARAARPAVLHIHGGGYVLGNPEINDQANRTLVAELGCVIVSVDYRLAPETPFPGALKDCYAALLWLHAHADALSVDQSRIAISGESAGGGHAAALALFARDRSEVPICFQLLDAPMLDDRTGSAFDAFPERAYASWSPANNAFGWGSLLGREPGGADTPADAVPARAENLAGLPATFMLVGALDLFAEENLEFARRLLRAGVATELHLIPGAYHGFGIAGATAPQVAGAQRLKRDALARAFQGLI